MYTINDFYMLVNHQRTTLAIDKFNFKNYNSVDFYSNDPLHFPVSINYVSYLDYIVVSYGYAFSSFLKLGYGLPITDSILNAVSFAIENYRQDVYDFFSSNDYLSSELRQYIWNRHYITNEDVLNIADIIRKGCLDFKLEPKFDTHFAKWRILAQEPDEVVPIDFEAFFFNHVLKIGLGNSKYKMLKLDEFVYA